MRNHAPIHVLAQSNREKSTHRKIIEIPKDALNTFYLRLYGVKHMVKDHSVSERKPAAAT